MVASALASCAASGYLKAFPLSVKSGPRRRGVREGGRGRLRSITRTLYHISIALGLI